MVSVTHVFRLFVATATVNRSSFNGKNSRYIYIGFLPPIRMIADVLKRVRRVINVESENSPQHHGKD